MDYKRSCVERERDYPGGRWEELPETLQTWLRLGISIPVYEVRRTDKGFCSPRGMVSEVLIESTLRTEGCLQGQGRDLSLPGPAAVLFKSQPPLKRAALSGLIHK